MLCATVKSAPAQEHWSRLLPDIALALRACLDGDAGAMVVDAWPIGHGLVGARVQRAEGIREDCVAERTGDAVLRRDPVEAGDRRPGGGERAFMLDRRCVDARRVEGEGGIVLGWLAYPACG